MKFELICVREERNPTRCRYFATVTLRLTLMTLKPEGDLDILNNVPSH